MLQQLLIVDAKFQQISDPLKCYWIDLNLEGMIVTEFLHRFPIFKLIAIIQEKMTYIRNVNLVNELPLQNRKDTEKNDKYDS